MKSPLCLGLLVNLCQLLFYTAVKTEIRGKNSQKSVNRDVSTFWDVVHAND